MLKTGCYEVSYSLEIHILHHLIFLELFVKWF
nr:MAG TPA: hypothetical protein [Caudoviricetes sp.]